MAILYTNCADRNRSSEKLFARSGKLIIPSTTEAPLTYNLYQAKMPQDLPPEGGYRPIQYKVLPPIIMTPNSSQS